MAARENQGLQIALIIFVMLTILLSVSTYMLFTRFQEQQEKAKAAANETVAVEKKRQDLEADRGKLLTVIGNAPTDNVDTVMKEAGETFTTQFASAGMNGLPEESRNYKKALVSVLDAIKTKDSTIADRKKETDDAKAAAATAAATAKAEYDKISANKDQAIADLVKEQAAYKQSVEDLKKEKDTLVAEKTDKNKSMDELKATYERQMADLKGQLAKSSAEVRKIRDLLNVYSKMDPTETGGKITWVNQRENMAYVNMGYEDGLRRRITFSVYPPGTTDVATATPKGKIEVVNVTGPHQAEATILENPINNTLLAGDLIHTQGWRPGQHEHFAICGLIDIDGNSNDQTKKLHDLILANGGIVDAEIELRKDPNDPAKMKPSVKGNMTVNTRYLIVGEMSTDKPAAADRITPSTTLMNEAKRLGVEQVGLQKFLAMMGYTPRSGAGGANGGTVTVGPDRGDEFRPRTPPARGANGAF
jgi:hypothetical protein